MVFGGTRTFHRLTCVIEDAGWEIRDCMMWLYGSGFPKSHDISKAIDKAKGVEFSSRPASGVGFMKPDSEDWHVTKNQLKRKGETTDLARQWDGYGTALKPAWEPIIVAMKPLDGTFAQNAEKWGVGGLWIDGGRIEVDGSEDRSRDNSKCKTTDKFFGGKQRINQPIPISQGRWPANVILDEEAGVMLDEQVGELKSGGGNKKSQDPGMWAGKKPQDWVCNSNSGGASRFFYCAKASRSERNAGLEGMEAKRTDSEYRPGDDGTQGIQSRLHGATTKGQNNHPTVKPLKLMEYLCKLTKTPTGGVVLDPFGGSGTTALACINTGRKYILIEKDPHYCEIARARVKAGALFE